MEEGWPRGPWSTQKHEGASYKVRAGKGLIYQSLGDLDEGTEAQKAERSYPRPTSAPNPLLEVLSWSHTVSGWGSEKNPIFCDRKLEGGHLHLNINILHSTPWKMS